MLKLKLQYFSCLLRTANSLEKSLMLGKTEGNRRRAQQRMRHSITDSMSTSLSREIVKDREAWRAAACGVTMSQTLLSDCTTTIPGSSNLSSSVSLTKGYNSSVHRDLLYLAQTLTNSPFLSPPEMVLIEECSSFLLKPSDASAEITPHQGLSRNFQIGGSRPSQQPNHLLPLVTS